jgi:TolA-binding protein
MKLYEAAANGNVAETAAKARMRLGELLEAREEFDAARKHYMMIVVLVLHEELSPEALLRAGRCSEKIGNPDDAIERYRELLNEFPESEQAEPAQARLKELAPV